MGTVEAIGKAKLLARRMASEIYLRSPGCLQSLRGKVVILMYHRVVTTEELSRQFIQPGMYVTAKTFEHHVRFLQEHFVVLSLNELLDMWRQDTWSPDRRYAVITFDDGWLDNYVHAFPILRRYEAPATIFLATGYIGTTRWFWPEQVGWLCQRLSETSAVQRKEICERMRRQVSWFANIAEPTMGGRSEVVVDFCKTLDVERIEWWICEMTEHLGVKMPDERLLMNWVEARAMSAGKITFGAHSVNHKILTKLPKEEVEAEVSNSMRALREQLLEPIPVFCYPNGNYSSEIMQCVKYAGYQAAITTDPGWEDRHSSELFRLKRVGIHNDLTYTDSLFAFHLAGFNSDYVLV